MIFRNLELIGLVETSIITCMGIETHHGKSHPSEKSSKVGYHRNWNVLHQSRSDRVPCYRGRTFSNQGLSQPLATWGWHLLPWSPPRFCNSCFEIYCAWGQSRDIICLGPKHLYIVKMPIFRWFAIWMIATWIKPLDLSNVGGFIGSLASPSTCPLSKTIKYDAEFIDKNVW
jgi:hypothetical protein